jgi:MFS family permease
LPNRTDSTVAGGLEAAAQKPTGDPGPRREVHLVTGVAALGAFSGTLIQTAVVPLLPTIAAATGATIADASWLVTATVLAGAAASASAGPLGDRFGHKKALIGVQAFVILGSLLTLTSSDLRILIVARALQGIGAAAIPLGLALLRARLSRAGSAKAIGTTSSLVMIGGLAGTLLAAIVTTLGSWHGVFLAIAILGVVNMMLSFVVPARPDSQRSRLAPSGIAEAILVPAGISALLLAVIKAPSWGSSPRMLFTAGSGVLLLASWYFVQARSERPLLPASLLGGSARGRVHLAALATGFAIYCSALGVPQLLQNHGGLNLPLLPAALLTIPAVVASAGAALVSPRAITRLGDRGVVVCGAVSSAVGLAVLAFGFQAVIGIIAGSVIAGFGTSLAYSALPVQLMQRVSAAETGRALGLNAVSRAVGNGLSSATFASIAAAGVAGSSAPPSTFPLFFLSGVVFSIVIGVSAMRPRQGQGH